MPADPFPKEQQLRDFEKRWHEKRNASRREAPEMLFHCTGTLGAVVGMASSQKIWATDVRFLNDRTEIEHGMDLVADLLADRSLASSDIAMRVVRFVSDRRSLGFDRIRLFVFCLCQESDLANQWFMYADQGKGFELGFDLGPVGGSHGLILRDASRQQTPFALERVIYEEDEKRAELRQVLSDVIEALEAMPAPGSHEEVEDLVARAGSMALGELYSRCAAMKHRSFRNEYEWRLVYLVARGTEQEKYVQRRPPSFRPFVELELRGTSPDFLNRLPLRQVLVGPHMRLDNERILLREILEEGGFTELLTHVRDAACPLQ